jgi:glucokinase
MRPTVPSQPLALAGVDLGGTQVRVAFASADGTVRNVARAKTKELETPENVVTWIAEQAERHAGYGTVRSAAIGAPGPVDPRHGMLINPPNLGDHRLWHNLPIAALLSEVLNCPVHVENDANLAGLGEFHQGAGRGSRDMVYITWSTGVGAGVVCDGRLISGAHGSAGEVGHMIIDPDGPLCGCGQRGCVEAICSGTNVQQRYGRAPVELLASAAEGDALGLQVLDEMSHAMGTALINVCNLYDPEVIVMGGGVTAAWAQLREPTLAVLRASPFVKANRRPRVRRAVLGARVGEVGAVEWARVWLGEVQPSAA